MKYKIKNVIDGCLQKNPCEIEIRFDEPMSLRTTFKTGGPADCWVRPGGEGVASFCVSLLTDARKADVPVFILGGGANIVVSDKGIRGIVLDTRAWKGENVHALCANKNRVVWKLQFLNKSNELVLKSGTDIDEAADIAFAQGLSGLEFLAGMPGTVGGALWMNARCYGKEIADVLSWVELIGHSNNKYEIKRYTIDKKDFDYKKSPFQKMDCLILNAAFKLSKGDKDKMLEEMDQKRQDRRDKGHYLFPCAGSAFKNNRDFGKPTGQIIDELGLKGFTRGGAQVAPFHGNIIINTGNATAGDIRELTDEIIAKVKEATGFLPEPEILFIGEF